MPPLQEQRTKLQKAGFDPEVFNQTQHNLRHAEAQPTEPEAT